MNERRFGPKKADHPSIGEACPACRIPFATGDYTARGTLGPGNDSETQERARLGSVYNAVAVEVHYACRTGLP